MAQDNPFWFFNPLKKQKSVSLNGSIRLAYRNFKIQQKQIHSPETLMTQKQTNLNSQDKQVYWSKRVERRSGNRLKSHFVKIGLRVRESSSRHLEYISYVLKFIQVKPFESDERSSRNNNISGSRLFLYCVRLFLYCVKTCLLVGSVVLSKS